MYMYDLYINIVFLLGLAPKDPMKKAFNHFGVDQNTIDFVGHALALYRDDK